jgi:predicted nucleic acid-binding Zn ribbon protein
MGAEAAIAALVGAAALWLVLRPIFVPPKPRAALYEPPDPEETERGVALTALKEIEFDRETGKLSDADYELLKRKYTAAALDALRHEQASAPPTDIEAMIAGKVAALRGGHPACATCGPRPEPDALFCSGCGRQLSPGAHCERCGAALGPESRFCEGCGSRVAA